ncbi:MAG: hypothetical protein J1F64_05690 [Oscillospiraceae bacterium]|nr:hypothetical protein [Oscillospiraceae bacterium]
MDIKKNNDGNGFELTAAIGSEVKNIGEIIIYRCRAFNKDYTINAKDARSLGADIIFGFHPHKNFGTTGDICTFVQLVADDFSYKTSDEAETTYTWSKDKTQDLRVRNYDDTGNQNQSICIPLNYSIDQSFPDFRYTETRERESDTVSSRSKKIGALINALREDESKLKAFNLDKVEAVKDNLKRVSEESKVSEEIKRRLDSTEDSEIIPDVVYSAFKSSKEQFFSDTKEIGWGPGRMSDSPRTNTLISYKDIKGSQNFETLLMYEDKKNNKTYALCTLYWGWTTDNTADGPISVIIDPECRQGLPEHWENAKNFWNKCGNKLKIPDDIRDIDLYFRSDS